MSEDSIYVKSVPYAANYLVGHDGSVYSLFGPKGIGINKLSLNAKDKDGYPKITLKLSAKVQKVERVHRLVGNLFIPNPDNLPEVCHQDANRTNNHVSNLKWGSRKDNGQDMIRHKSVAGNNHPLRKLSESDIPTIINLGKTLHPIEIAKMYNVSRGCIEMVLSRRNWKHVNV